LDYYSGYKGRDICVILEEIKSYLSMTDGFEGGEDIVPELRRP
jgi:hypothetical protein